MSPSYLGQCFSLRMLGSLKLVAVLLLKALDVMQGRAFPEEDPVSSTTGAGL